MKYLLDGKFVGERLPMGKNVGAFETFRIARGAVFALNMHMARLASACKILGVSTPSRSLVTKSLKKLISHVSRPNESDFRAKIIVFPDAKGKRHVAMGIELLPPLKFEKVSCAFVKATPSKYPFKSTDRTEYGRCEKIAKAKGFDLPILVHKGRILESSIANVFIVKKGIVYTPPVSGVVDGVARKTVLSLCKKLGIKARIKKMAKNDVLSADEVFLTNALRFVFGISSIGRKKSGVIKVAKQLFGKYRKLALNWSKFV